MIVVHCFDVCFPGGVLEPFRGVLLSGGLLPLNYFLHVAFRAIFEAFSYIVLETAKIVTQSPKA